MSINDIWALRTLVRDVCRLVLYVGVQIMIEDLELMELRKRIDLPAHGTRGKAGSEGSEGATDGVKRGQAGSRQACLSQTESKSEERSCGSTTSSPTTLAHTRTHTHEALPWRPPLTAASAL